MMVIYFVSMCKSQWVSSKHWYRVIPISS